MREQVSAGAAETPWWAREKMPRAACTQEEGDVGRGGKEVHLWPLSGTHLSQHQFLLGSAGCLQASAGCRVGGGVTGCKEQDSLLPAIRGGEYLQPFPGTFLSQFEPLLGPMGRGRGGGRRISCRG